MRMRSTNTNSSPTTIITIIRSYLPPWLPSLILGQLLSLCITTTNLTTKLLNTKYQVNLPTFQSFGNYLILGLIFTSYSVMKLGWVGYGEVMRKRGKLYLILAIVDVEANYFIVKGFAKTSYLSAMLINAFSTPGVVLLSFLFLKVRYLQIHLIGIFLALVGLILLIISDILTSQTYEGVNPIVGDLYCIIGALLYATSNIMEEYSIRRYPNWELLGFLGLFGTIVNGLQLLLLERHELHHLTFTLPVVQLYLTFTFALFTLYTLVPTLIQFTSATFYNLSLLTSDFYSLVLGLALFHPEFHPLYPISFTIIIIGLLVYNLQPPLYPTSSTTSSHSSPDEQSPLLPSSSSSSPPPLTN